jgi:ApbE family
MNTIDYTTHTADSFSRSMFTFDATGTQWEIETLEPLGRQLQQRILRRIETFDTTYSRFRPDSFVSQVAASEGGCFDFPDDSLALFDLYDRLHTATAGALDPLVGRDLELLGYDRTYSLMPVSELIRAEANAWGRVSWSKDVLRDGTSIVTWHPLVIDVGAVGKGYLVDIVSKILREAGFARFVVDGSGDMRHSGESSLRVGLEHPFDSRLAIGVANLQDCAPLRSTNGLGATVCITYLMPELVSQFEMWWQRGLLPMMPRSPTDWQQHSSSQGRSVWQSFLGSRMCGCLLMVALRYHRTSTARSSRKRTFIGRTHAPVNTANRVTPGRAT